MTGCMIEITETKKIRVTDTWFDEPTLPIHTVKGAEFLYIKPGWYQYVGQQSISTVVRLLHEDRRERE